MEVIVITPRLSEAPSDLRVAVDKLIALPYVQGLVLVGSRSRGYHEQQSDFDLEVIVDDVFYETLAPLKRLMLVWEGLPFKSRLIGDIYTISRTQMENKRASVVDVDHWPYEVAGIWYDRDGQIAPLIAALGAFPEAIWAERVNVHHVDFWYHVGRGKKIAPRASRLNYGLVLTRAIHAYIKFIFVLNRRWPPLVHWAEQAIQQTKLPLRPANDIELLTQALTTLDLAPLETLAAELPALLDEVGLTLHQERLTQLVEVLGPTYDKARESWSRY